MLALPLTPTTPQVHLDSDCASRGAAVASKMGVPSYERPSSPSIFTASNMSQSRPQTPSQKRPKLSLQTSSLPITFGKSSTGLVIAASALPTTSPTVLNTFNNAYDMSHRFSPATASPTGTRSARPTSRFVSPFAWSIDDRPYLLPLGLKGILRNSSVPSSLRRSSLCPAGESPRTGRRVFFPAAKKVTFNVALEEEIHTTTYIAKHSDLSSDEEDSNSDEASEPSFSSSDESEMDVPPKETTLAEPMQQRKKRKAGSDRQIQAAAIRDCIGSTERLQKGLRPKFQMRTKRRRRHWQWTLEPLKETSPGGNVLLLVRGSDLLPSQIPLPFSAAPECVEPLVSPSKIPLPPSATPAPLMVKSTTPLPSPSQISLPLSATLTSPVLPSGDIKAGEDNIKVAVEYPVPDR